LSRISVPNRRGAKKTGATRGWNDFIESVISFSKKEDVEIPDLSAQYVEGRGRRQRDKITKEHHYHFDIYNVAIDFQLQELNSRFNEQAMELLTLSLALNPNDGYKSFNIEDICKLAKKFYPLDFSEQEMMSLRYQLQHFEFETQNHPKLHHLSSLSELCQVFAETNMSKTFYLIDRMIRLILTLPVSTATGERAFSAMKIVKTRLRNKMEDEFLADNLVVYIEKEIAETFSSDSILDGFVDLKERRVQFR